MPRQVNEKCLILLPGIFHSLPCIHFIPCPRIFHTSLLDFSFHALAFFIPLFIPCPSFFHSLFHSLPSLFSFPFSFRALAFSFSFSFLILDIFHSPCGVFHCCPLHFSFLVLGIFHFPWVIYHSLPLHFSFLPSTFFIPCPAHFSFPLGGFIPALYIFHSLPCTFFISLGGYFIPYPGIFHSPRGHFIPSQGFFHSPWGVFHSCPPYFFIPGFGQFFILLGGISFLTLGFPHSCPPHFSFLPWAFSIALGGVFNSLFWVFSFPPPGGYLFHCAKNSQKIRKKKGMLSGSTVYIRKGKYHWI
jgi:hypothetical protein